MIYEILFSILSLFIVGTTGSVPDMHVSEPEYMFNTTSIIQIPKPDGTQYWRYIVSGSDGQVSTVALDENQVSLMHRQGHTIRPDYTVTLHQNDKSNENKPTYIDQHFPTHPKYNGTGITIAIIDSGGDFSNMDIRNSLKRDENGFPVMLDTDGQGIVMTNSTFRANIDQYGVLRQPVESTSENVTSVVGLTGDGVFLNMMQDDIGTIVTVYNGIYPHNHLPITFNATVLNNMKIGEHSRDYIVSQSGIYRLGFLYQPGPDYISNGRAQVVPMLVVDSEIAGIYDTVIPDMSTSWKDYNNPLAFGIQGYDFDFTDETPIRLGDGNEFLVYDTDGDGIDDYSAGILGAQVVDAFGIITGNKSTHTTQNSILNGTLLPAMDPDGEFLGVMSDSLGHGSLCTATITSTGTRQYDIYENGTMYSIQGVAPGASIIPIKSLWQGNVHYGALWVAGFDSSEQGWEYTGRPRAHIVSNSWGISAFPATSSAAGFDDTSLLYGALAVPSSLHQDYPGIVVIISAGNEGHGYGSVSTPSTSPFVTSVGATTRNVHVGYDIIANQPRFGNSTLHGDDVAYFSSRGPSIIGDTKPNIMATGAYAFIPAPVTEYIGSERLDDFSLFGGTSMAAPIVAGSAAILMQASFENNQRHDPFTIKNILAATSKDLGNDPFVQGSGLVNITKAVGFVTGDNSSFLIYNDATYENMIKILKPMYESFNLNEYDLKRLTISNRPLQQYEWFAGHLLPEEQSTTVFTVENPSENFQTVTIDPVYSRLIEHRSYNGTTQTYLKDSILDDDDAYAPQYIRLSDVQSHNNIADYFNTKNMPENVNLLVLNLRFIFDDFMNLTDTMYADKTQTATLYLYDWVDENNDAEITSDEISLINQDSLWGNMQQIRVSDPASKFKGTPVVGVFAPPYMYSYWRGTINENATSMDYTLLAQYYRQTKWGGIWIEDGSVEIPPGGTASVRAILTVPQDQQTGVYQGAIRFKGDEHTAIVPVSYAVTTPAKLNVPITVTGNDSDLLFDARNIDGASSLLSNYGSGGWRQFYFEIDDSEINTGIARISWKDLGTQITVFAISPSGKIISSTADSGSYEELDNSVSSDWLGSGIDGSGGFYPVTNINSTSVGMYISINQTGTWYLLAHSSVYGGAHNVEPINMSLQFTNLS